MIALIAGQGALPGVLCDRLAASGASVVICAMAGFPPDVPSDLPRIDFRIEHLGSLLGRLSDLGADRVVMAGSVRRPPIEPDQIDAATRPLIPRLTAALAKGDDGTLREIISLFEEHGLAVVGAHEIAPELVQPPAILAGTVPDTALRDAEIGAATVARMGAEDRGQACVIRDGIVLAEEDAAGTDAMLARLAVDRVDEPVPAPGGMAPLLGGAMPVGAGILFKAPKPGQDLRVDMPTIGPATVQGVWAAGLSGIVIEAGGVLVLDLPQVVALCDRHGLFLWSRPAEDGA